MDDSSFENLADRTLQRLETRLADQLEDADVELRGGILTIELADGRQYVINKHVPNRQIWLSSPVSGAAHFAHDAATGAWRSTRDTSLLHERLATELSAVTGSAVTLD